MIFVYKTLEIEDSDIQNESVDKFTVVEDLIKKGASDTEIKQAVDECVRVMDEPGGLERAEKAEVAYLRNRIKDILRKTPQTEDQIKPITERVETFYDEHQEELKEIPGNIKKLLKERLSNPTALKEGDISAIALEKYIKDNDINIAELEKFLKNPGEIIDFKEETIKNAWNIRVPDNEKKNPEQKLTIKEARTLVKKLKLELEKTNENLKFFRGSQRPKPEEIDKRNTLLDEQQILKELIEQAEAYTQVESRDMRYSNPRQVLAMAYLFKNQDKNTTPAEMEKDLDQYTDDAKESIGNSVRGKFNTIAGLFFRPDLKSTLIKIAEKDTAFSKIAENPTEKIAELAKLVGGDQKHIKEWAKSLNGDYETNINTVIPRLATYLELAMRDGKAGYLAFHGRAQKIVKHLKDLRRDFVEDKVNDEALAKGLNNQEKMLMFINEMNKANKYTSDISKELLQRHAGITLGKTLLKVGAGAVAVAVPVTALAALPLAAGAALWKRDKIPENIRPIVEKASKRTLLATGLFAGSAITAGAMLGIPLAAAAFLPKTTPKWLWKHKAAPITAGVAAAKGTAKAISATAGFAGKAVKETVKAPITIAKIGAKGITGTAKLGGKIAMAPLKMAGAITKTGFNTAKTATKYTVGLPFLAAKKAFTHK